MKILLSFALILAKKNNCWVTRALDTTDCCSTHCSNNTMQPPQTFSFLITKKKNRRDQARVLRLWKYIQHKRQKLALNYPERFVWVRVGRWAKASWAKAQMSDYSDYFWFLVHSVNVLLRRRRREKRGEGNNSEGTRRWLQCWLMYINELPTLWALHWHVHCTTP